jgi:hypothetical protein
VATDVLKELPLPPSGFPDLFLKCVSMKWQPKITFSYMEKGTVYLCLHWVEFHLHAPTVHRIPLHIPRRIAVRHSYGCSHETDTLDAVLPARTAVQVASRFLFGPSEALRSKRTAKQTWPYGPMVLGLNYDQATSIHLPCLYSISLRFIKILTFHLLGLPSSRFAGSFPVKIPHLFPNLSVELQCQLFLTYVTPSP